MVETIHHAHKGLAYLLFLLVTLDLLLALAGAGTKKGMARAVGVLQLIGVRVVGPLIILGGCVLWWSLRAGLPPETWWIWAAFVCWGVVEVAAKRLVSPAVLTVADGGAARGSLILGTALQFVGVVAAFGLMQANAGG